MAHPFALTLRGSLVAFAGIGALAAIMVPFRGTLSVATTALVLVIPVVAGVAAGGFAAGVVASVAGFLAYDVLFIPPYGTLAVGAGQNWAALGVYLLVVLLVARLVAFLQEARAQSQLHEEETRRLYHLAERLIGDQPLGTTLAQVLATVEEAFHPAWAAILLPDGDTLSLAATIGQPGPEELAELRAPTGRLHAVGPSSARLTVAGQHRSTTVALSVKGRPIGILALPNVALTAHERDLLGAYSAQAAQAIERSQLRDAALRTEVLEAAQRWQKALLGAVSHDLRTPLSTIKAAVSTLRAQGVELGDDQEDELLCLVETQADNLARLVTNLLDLSRIDSGSLRLDRQPTAVEDLVAAALAVGDVLDPERCLVSIACDLPPVDVDELLMVQVLANLLENAARHSPAGRPVEVTAAQAGPRVEVSVRDHGPGVALADRQRIFEAWVSSPDSGRAGLGLAIARAFVEAHGERLSLESPPGGGARFVVTMAVVPASLPDQGAKEGHAAARAGR